MVSYGVDASLAKRIQQCKFYGSADDHLLKDEMGEKRFTKFCNSNTFASVKLNWGVLSFLINDSKPIEKPIFFAVANILNCK